MENFVPYYIKAAGTYTVLPSDGFLHAITVNTTANGTITVYDSATATAVNVIAVIKASVAEQTFIYDVRLVNGLTIVTGAASDITVSYT